MKYSIGQFASMLGVTPDTLRLYEKYKIINPKKNEKNNYRYFNDLDARNLLMSRWYRSMEISLQDASNLTKDPSLSRTIENIEETQRNLEKEIKRKTMLLNKINEINSNLKTIKISLNKCEKKKVPGIYRLKQTDRNILLQDEFLTDTVHTWMDILPYTFFSFRIGKNEFLTKESYFNYSWGLAINDEEVDDFDLQVNDNVEYIPPRTCISSIIITPDKEYLMKDSLQFMIDYIKEHDYFITGDVIGKIITTDKIENEKKSYLEVNIPMEKKYSLE